MKVVEDPLELPPHLATIAERYFGETPERRRSALLEFRKRIEALPETDRLQDLSDKNLIRFIRNFKFNMDKAFNATIAYVKFRRAHPELFIITEEEVKLQNGIFNVVIGSPPEYRVVITIMPKKMVYQMTEAFLKLHPQYSLRFNMWCMEVLSMMPEVQVCGIAAVVSFKGFTFSDNITMSRVVSLSDNMKIYYYLQSCLGTKLKGQYMFEVPMVIRTVMNIITSFMSKKVRSRYHTGGNDYSILRTHFHDNMNVLPIEFGGTAPEGATPWLMNEVKKMRMGEKNDDTTNLETNLKTNLKIDDAPISTFHTSVSSSMSTMSTNPETQPPMLAADIGNNPSPESVKETEKWLIRSFFLLLFLFILLVHVSW